MDNIYTRLDIIEAKLDKLILLLSAKNDQDYPISIDEASKITGLKITTIKDRVKNGLIPHVVKGDLLYFRRNEIMKWVNERRPLQVPVSPTL